MGFFRKNSISNFYIEFSGDITSWEVFTGLQRLQEEWGHVFTKQKNVIKFGQISESVHLKISGPNSNWCTFCNFVIV